MMNQVMAFVLIIFQVLILVNVFDVTLGFLAQLVLMTGVVILLWGRIKK